MSPHREGNLLKRPAYSQINVDENCKNQKNRRKMGFPVRADLEDFVWKNLLQLLQLQPLAKQHSSDDRNRFDILGLSQDKSLSIIELKLGIDDGIVSQLTRYHESAKNRNSFTESADSEKTISLIAIGNDFHKNSLIDAKYSHLKFRFLKYEDIKPLLPCLSTPRVKAST